MGFTPASESGAQQALPQADTIQRLFGRHDIGAIQAHQAPEAQAQAAAMGASGYAQGSHIALPGAGPSLADRTLPHEAAHVVQQASGLF